MKSTQGRCSGELSRRYDVRYYSACRFSSMLKFLVIIPELPVFKSLRGLASMERALIGLKLRELTSQDIVVDLLNKLVFNIKQGFSKF